MSRRAWLALGLGGLLALAGGLLWQLLPPDLPEPLAEGFVLRGVTLVEPARGRRPGAELRVAEGRIAAGGSGDAPVLEGFAGHTVLPGLIDMHAHLPAASALDLTSYFGLLHVGFGVTSVRDAGDIDGTAVPAAIRAFEEEGRPGPRVFPCGPFVSGPNPRWANSRVVSEPAEAAAVVEELVAEGARCIKVYDDLDVARIRALVEAARARGLPAMGHVPYGLTLEEARVPDTQHLMGVARPAEIERGDHVVFRIVDWRGVDEARMDEVARLSRELGLVHTPTLVSTHQLRHFEDYEAARRDPVVMLLPRLYTDVAWHPTAGLPFYRNLDAEDHATIRDAAAKKLRMVAKLHAAGVGLHLGTDSPQPFVVPGAALWTEMGLFAQAGIPLEEIWADATSRAGASLGVPGLGTLGAGAPADLLLFREDPTRDLAALDSLAAVVVRGRLYTRDQLDTARGRWRAHYAGFLVDRLSLAVARRVISRSVQRDF